MITTKHPVKRFLYFSLAIAIGWAGGHHFYAGYPDKGANFMALSIIAILCETSITSGIGSYLFFTIWIISIIQGITVLTKKTNNNGFIEI